MRQAAIFILYNPNEELVLRNLECVLKQIEHVYIIDNSESSLYTIDWRKISCVSYYSCNGNKGIAYALNLGCKKAMDDGYTWALTMDQDSFIPDNMVADYSSFINTFSVNNKIGALMPEYSICYNSKKERSNVTLRVVDYMTSGSFIFLPAYNQVGGFNDTLFIDMVDRDFGLKLIDNGYNIYKIGSVFMPHNIGNAKEYTILGKHWFYVTNHNYLRRYYITRNLLYISSVYGDRYPMFDNAIWQILKSIVRVIIFEKGKLKKLRSIHRGYVDFVCQRYGKYPYND